MSECQSGASIAHRIVILLAMSLVTACVIVPYKPGAEISRLTDLALAPDRILVTAAQREMIEDISHRIRSEDSAIAILDPVAFADAAFVDDDMRLSRLLTPTACARVREQTGADFLVLVGGLETASNGQSGFMMFDLGFYGAAKSEQHATIRAAIFDLKTAHPLCHIDSVARGTALGAGLFYGLFIIPLTESGAMDGAGLREESGKGPLTIAVMAADSVGGYGADQFKASLMPVEPVEAQKPLSPAEAALLRSIQGGLRKVGYVWVPADGQLDACTRAAIRQFQNSPEYTGRVVDEMPSQELLTDIKRAIEKGMSAKQPHFQPDDCPPLTSGDK